MDIGCYKNTIRLRSGAYFDLANPSGPIAIEDIAGALAKLCRFGGQCRRFYSVAEHSVLCAWQAYTDRHPLEVCLAVLFHDATEAFCGDMVRPLKTLMPEYKAIEARVASAIGKALGIDFDKHKEVIREIDNAMLFAERDILFDNDGVVWYGQNESRKLNPILSFWEPERAESEFLMCMHELRGLQPCA
jgi:hypothetical protein